MTAHYLFDPDFCNVASGWEKGIVEKNVQDMRRRIWNEAKQLQLSSFEELNIWLEARCRALWSEVQHPNVTARHLLSCRDLWYNCKQHYGDENGSKLIRSWPRY